MNNNTIIKYSDFNALNLNSENYTASLFEEAVRVKLLSEEEVFSFQAQLVDIVKDLVYRYNKGMSSSVEVEEAEALFASVLFTIDAFCISFRDPLACLDALKSLSAKDIYKRGCDLVLEKLESAKNIYEKIKSSRLNTELHAYNTAIDVAIPEFFETYDEVFAAHETEVTIDYPILFDAVHLKGITYFLHYLNHLLFENEFCNLYKHTDYNKILQSYGNSNNTNYKELFVNLFELVLVNSVFSVLWSKSADGILISENTATQIAQKIKQLKDASDLAVDEAFEIIIKTLPSESTQTKEYVLRYKPLFVNRLKTAVENDSIEKMIVCADTEKPQALYTLPQGNGMKDADFRGLVRKISSMTDSNDKVKLLLSATNSLKDFIDILKSDCLFSEDYTLLWQTLGDIELAILTKTIFEDSLVNEDIHLHELFQNKNIPETEWQQRLYDFLQMQSESKLKAIEQYINAKQ